MPTARLQAPYYPIIYVRGYAGNDADMENTAADPYMGFNIGATKVRQRWTGEVARHYFESPIVRLMKDFDYTDVYSAGLELAPQAPVPPRCIVIYRYYDQLSASFGDRNAVSMEEFGQGLGELILKLRDRLAIDDEARGRFRVHLVGHSMGGLVIRCLLQNPNVGPPEAKEFIDKVFTYATPHNGIEAAIIGNVSGFFSPDGRRNFNRERMAEYLGLPAGTDPVNTLAGAFDPDRMFCLVGTNADDNLVARGWSSRVVGPYSDGLVRINNAVVHGPDGGGGSTGLAPRAYVHRSHSGHYGIVNSEEGYQNLTRFLFGDARVDGVLEVENISLPPDVERLRAAGRRVHASYHFECITKVRGACWDLSRRVSSEHSTVFRTYGELFPDQAIPGIDRPNHNRPELFTTFLNSDARVDRRRPSLGFAVDLGVLVPEYEVDGRLFMRNHFPGGYLFRDKINLEAIPPRREGDVWRLRASFDSSTPNRATRTIEPEAGDGRLRFRIPIVQSSRPGIRATLELTARQWNA